MVSLKEVCFFTPKSWFLFFLVILRGRDSCETPHVIKSDGKSRILKDGSNILANTGFEPPMWNFDNSKSHLAKSVLWQTRDLCHNWYSLEGWTHLLSIFTKFHCSFYFGATGAFSYQILQLTHWFPTLRKKRIPKLGDGAWHLAPFQSKECYPLKTNMEPLKKSGWNKVEIHFSHKTNFSHDWVGRWFSQKTDISPVSYLLSIFPTRTCRVAHNWAALQYWCAAWSRHLRCVFLFFGWWTIKNLKTSLWGLFIDIFDMIISIQPLPDIPRFPTKRLLLGES